MLFSRTPISMTMSRCGQTGVDCASRGGDRGGGTGALLGAALSPASPHSLDHHTLTLGLSCHHTIPYHTTMHFISAYQLMLPGMYTVHYTIQNIQIIEDICPKYAQIVFTKNLPRPSHNMGFSMLQDDARCVRVCGTLAQMLWNNSFRSTLCKSGDDDAPCFAI